MAVLVLSCLSVSVGGCKLVEPKLPVADFPAAVSVAKTLAENPLAEGEDVKVTPFTDNRAFSSRLVQVRAGQKYRAQYHKAHDKVVLVWQGAGIAILGTDRYRVEAGTLLTVPVRTPLGLINDGGEPLVVLSVFVPPFDGKDEKLVKLPK